MEGLLTYLLPIAIGIIMLGIGFNLRTSDFKRVFIAPKAILSGLVGQLVILPLIGFTIAYLSPIDPIYKLGIVLIASCPGGTSSNIVTYMLKGRVALSVSITAFNSFLIILTIPFFLELGFQSFIAKELQVSLSLQQTFFEVLYTVLTPVLLGMFVNHNFPEFTDRLKKPLRYILPAILFLVFTLVLLNENDNGGMHISEYTWLLIPAFILNIVVMLIGFVSSGLIGINHEGKYTIAIEMGLQNSALAIFLANNVLQYDGLAVIAVIYGGFSFFSTFILAYVMKHYWKM